MFYTCPDKIEQGQKIDGKAISIKDNNLQLTFISIQKQVILDSLVVRISACHVEGPGSIPGRGVYIF